MKTQCILKRLTIIGSHFSLILLQFFLPPAHAQFVPNFEGDFKARASIAQPDGPVATSDIPLPPGLSTTKAVFDQTWQGQGANICNMIKTSVNFSEWHFCTPATDTELQVEPAGKNRFRIRYLARQTKVSFDATQDFLPLGEWFDPTIDISFDLMMEEQIYVDEDFSLAQASSVLPGPIYIPPARFSFSNASVTSEHIASGVAEFESLMAKERNRLNKINGDMPFAFTEGQRNQLKALVFGIGKALPRPGEGANDRFALDMTIEDKSFRLHFRRDKPIPAGPTACTVESSSCHVVIFACGTLPAESWAEIRSYPESWLEASRTFFDTATKRIGVLFSGEATYMYRVCSGNTFGKNCTPPMEVMTFLSGCGGGGGSTQLPRCPTGQSPCAGGQCTPISQCKFLK
jgi:hypothetical protein